MDDEEVSNRPSMDPFCPDFSLAHRRAHDESFKDYIDDPTLYSLELASTAFLYLNSEAMAEYMLSSMFTGIPGCWMRRDPTTSLPRNYGAPNGELDFAVMLHSYGSSSHLQVDRDSNLAISTVHPALLIAMKGPVHWPECEQRRQRTLSEVLRDLASYVQPNLEQLLDVLSERNPKMSSLPEFATIFGIVYDASRLYIVAHKAVTPSNTNKQTRVRGSQTRYHYVSEIVDSLDFPARASPDDGTWVSSRLKLFYALMVLRRHVHRLTSIWDDLPLPLQRWNAEDLHEVNTLGPLYIPPRTVSCHSSDLCGDCLREPCICDAFSEVSTDSGKWSERERKHVGTHTVPTVKSWLAQLEEPWDDISTEPDHTTVVESIWETTYDDIPDECRSPHWVAEHSERYFFCDSKRRHHVLKTFSLVFTRDLTLTLPETYSTSPAASLHAVGSHDYALDVLYRYAIVHITTCTPLFYVVPDSEYVANRPADDYSSSILKRCDVTLNPHPDDDARSLKNAILAVTLHPLPLSFEAPLECLVARVVQGFLEIRGCTVIRDADHRTRIPQIESIMHSCESAVATELPIDGLSIAAAFIVLAVLPWDCRNLDEAQERLALRFQNTLKLLLYLFLPEMSAVSPVEDRSFALPKWACLVGAIYTRSGIVFVGHWPEWLIEERRWRFVSTVLDDTESREWWGEGAHHTAFVAVRLLRLQYHAAYVAGKIRELLRERGTPDVNAFLSFPLDVQEE